MKPEFLLSNKPSDYSTLYIDMNSFFASVEQYHDPRLRNRPVAVSTALSGGASVIAASIEAKRAGIKTGTKLADARQLCPELVVIHDSPNSYRKIHREIMAVLNATPCRVQPKSIDEAYLKIPSYLQNRKSALELAKSIKASLSSTYGRSILCSIGVASNIWLAKMAGNSQKPDGLVLLNPSKYAEFYRSLVLTDLTGINHRMARRLYDIGIYNPTDLYGASWRLLNNKLGVNGGKWYFRMRGYEVDDIKINANKSISHQITTMPNPPSSFVEITTYINKIAINLGERLRSKSLASTGIAIFIKYVDGNWWGRDYKKVVTIRSNYEIIKLSNMLLKKLKYFSSPVRRINITLFNLVADNQLSIGALREYDAKDRHILASVAIDTINSRYGKGTIVPIRSLNTEHINTNRIGFAGDLIRENSKIN